jgi:hypothetical protein
MFGCDPSRQRFAMTPKHPLHRITDRLGALSLAKSSVTPEEVVGEANRRSFSASTSAANVPDSNDRRAERSSCGIIALRVAKKRLRIDNQKRYCWLMAFPVECHLNPIVASRLSRKFSK